MELTEKDASAMSRQEALRVLSTAEGVPAQDRRMALLMLAGPDITSADMGKGRPRRPVMAVAVHAALAQLSFEIIEARAADLSDLRELGGMRA